MVGRSVRKGTALLVSLILLGAAGRDGRALAADQAGEGVTFLGTGFTGKPFVLAGEIVLETDGSWNCTRDYVDPARPGWLGWHDVSVGTGFWDPGLYEDGRVVALLRDLAAGASFVDFSDPTQPQDLGGFAGNTYTCGLVRAGHLYLGLPGLVLVYDVTSPALPVFRAAFVAAPNPLSRWLCAAGDFVYFVETDNLVRCLDTTAPGTPIDRGSFALAGDRIDALAASAGALYALVTTATGPGSGRVDLVTVDVTAPVEPVETSRWALNEELGAAGRQLLVDGDLLLAGETGGTVRGFDLASPLQPVPGFVLPLYADHLTMSAGHVFVLVGDELRIYQRTPAAAEPPLVAVRHRLPELETLAGEGPRQLAQSAKDRSLLYVLDVRNPANPEVVREFDAGVDGTLAHRGGLAVLAGERDFQVVDLADPLAPRLRGTGRLVTAGYTQFLAVSRKLVGIGRFNSFATELWDLSDLDHPAFVSEVPGQVFPLAIGRDSMLFGEFGRIRIFDVSDPRKPHDYGHLPLEGERYAGSAVVPTLTLGDVDRITVHVVGTHVRPSPYFPDRPLPWLSPTRRARADADRHFVRQVLRDHLRRAADVATHPLLCEIELE